MLADAATTFLEYFPIPSFNLWRNRFIFLRPASEYKLLLDSNIWLECHILTPPSSSNFAKWGGGGRSPNRSLLGHLGERVLPVGPGPSLGHLSLSCVNKTSLVGPPRKSNVRAIQSGSASSGPLFLQILASPRWPRFSIYPRGRAQVFNGGNSF